MPTYEYACQSCGTHVEVYQRFNEASLTECGLCGGPLRKVFHPAGILFKGSGFYVTDSRAGASKGKDSEGKGAEGRGAEGRGADRATPEKKDAPAKVGSSKDGATKGDSGGSAGGGSSGAGSKGESTSSPAAKERSA